MTTYNIGDCSPCCGNDCYKLKIEIVYGRVEDYPQYQYKRYFLTSYQLWIIEGGRVIKNEILSGYLKNGFVVAYPGVQLPLPYPDHIITPDNFEIRSDSCYFSSLELTLSKENPATYEGEFWVEKSDYITRLCD